MVVDDNEASAILAATLLECADFAVDIAPDAESALRMARRWTPDAIVVDWRLPGMDGLSLVQLVRADPSMERVALLGTSSNDLSHPRVAAMAALCDAYVAKPLPVVYFAESLRLAIERRRLRRESAWVPEEAFSCAN